MRRSRIESMGRAVEIEEGIAARFADPLWLLGRQWQLGELDGDDAAQPAAVRVDICQAPIVSYRPEGDTAEPSPSVALPRGVPLERLVESGPRPATGFAGLHRRVRDGQRLAKRLRDSGLAEAVTLLRSAFPSSAPDARAPRLPRSDAAGAELLVRRGLDADAIAGASDSRRAEALEALPAARRTTAMSIIREWALGVESPRSDAWIPSRFEHRFTVAADDDGDEVLLRADEHQGGRVDWHSFDIDTASPGHGKVRGGTRATRRIEVTTIAAPVRFAGMPASRWWEFEDAEVNFGDLDAGPGDLARLAVAEFAAVYNDDWFVVPVRAERSSLLRVEKLTVIDTFGIEHPIHAASVIDHELASRDSASDSDQRVWRFFELTGDTHEAQQRAPWLLIAPSLSSTLHGPELERVVFARDEDANLAWAVERLVEGPLGRPIDRGSTWAGWTTTDDADGAAPDDEPAAPRRYGDEHWRYELETSPPPWWIPMIPERQNDDTEQVRLRRARMATWDQHAASDVGPKGTLLEPDRPFHVHEEEVPRSGATVTRSWQWARWQDGSTHLWLQRRKQNGRGERSSGLEWDVLHDEAGPAPGRDA